MLKTLLLRKKLDQLKKSREAMEPTLEELRNKTAEFNTREAELEAAVNEIDETVSNEDKQVVTEEVDAFLQERSEHDEAVKKAEEEKEDLERQINETEAELAELEAKQEDKPAEEKPEPAPEDQPEERKKGKVMNRRTARIFKNLTAEQRSAILNSESVNSMLSEYRSAIREKRAITNAGLTIAEEVLPLLRENIANYSKLYDRVNVQQVSGEARQPIMGTAPEAIWTECCQFLNELDLVFNDWTMDCFKVGGYFALCKANVEDSDIDLLAAIVEALAQALGKAIDKAILFGRNTTANAKMPLGIVSRLAQTAAPADYPATARTWVDLHSTHIISLGTAQAPVSGIDLIKGLVSASAVASTDYSRGELLWAMNDKTYKSIVAESVEVNAAGAIVAGINGQMPVVGGDIVVLNFIPDNVIVFGYFDLYVLAERAGREFAQSEHVRFIQDQIVYKGTARYDGAPVIAEAFGAVALNGATVDPTAVTFPQDTANQGA